MILTKCLNISPLCLENNYTIEYKLNKLVNLSSYIHNKIIFKIYKKYYFLLYFFTWPKDLLVIGVISDATRTHDIEMNLHEDLKDNHGQLEQLKFAFIYISYSQRNF